MKAYSTEQQSHNLRATFLLATAVAVALLRRIPQNRHTPPHDLSCAYAGTMLRRFALLFFSTRPRLCRVALLTLRRRAVDAKRTRVRRPDGGRG